MRPSIRVRAGLSRKVMLSALEYDEGAGAVQPEVEERHYAHDEEREQENPPPPPPRTRKAASRRGTHCGPRRAAPPMERIVPISRMRSYMIMRKVFVIPTMMMRKSTITMTRLAVLW